MIKKKYSFRENRLRYRGLSQTPVGQAWRAMIYRCYKPNNINYKNYGGRGIRVCRRWHDLLMFFKDMGHKPEGMSLERINNDGHYSPKNCRWATKHEQMRNRRSNIYIEYNGERMIARDWEKKFGLRKGLIAGRMHDAGISGLQALQMSFR